MCKDNTSTSSQTTAPPANVSAAYNGLISQAQQTAAQPLQLYQGQLVAPLNATQTGAITDITNDQGIAAPYISQAQSDINASSTPFNAADVQQYESPYTNDVIAATEKQLQLQDAQQQQALQGNAVASGAYGGDRSAVLQSETAGQQDIANNATVANLENAGYSQALGEYNTNRQNLQGAGYALGALGSEAQNTALTGASAQLNAGTLEQQLAQEQLNVPYEQYLQEQAYPYQQESFLSGIDTGIGSLSGGTSSGTTTTPGASPFSQVLGLATTAAPFLLKDGGRTHLDDGGSTGPTPLQLAQMNPAYAEMLSSNNVANGAPAGTSVTAPMGLGQASDSQTSAPSFLTVPGASSGSAKDGGRIRLDSGGGAGLSPSYIEMMDANQMRGGSPLGLTGLPTVPNESTSFIPTASANNAHGSTMPTGNASAAAPAPASADSGIGSSLGSVAGQLYDKYGKSNPWGNTPLSDMGTGGSGADNVYLNADGSVFNGTFARGGHVSLNDVKGYFRKGGRVKLADGGDASFDDILNSLYPGDAVETASAAPSPAPTQPAGATLMSRDQVPDAWAAAATHMANPPVAAESDPAGPRWDNSGEPVATPPSGGPAPGTQTLAGTPTQRIIQPAYTEKPDWRRSLSLAGAAMMAGRSPNAGENIGAGVQAGLQNYYAQEDKDRNPVVDHSGPTTMVRYADGTTVDTGLPTEAALNAKAMNDYRLTNMDTIQAERQAAIAERAKAASDAVAQRKAAADEAAAGRANALEVARINANAGRYGQPIPGNGLDATGNTVPGVYISNGKTGQIDFQPGVQLTAKPASVATVITPNQALGNAQRDYDRFFPAPKPDPSNPGAPLAARAVPPGGMQAWIQNRARAYQQNPTGTTAPSNPAPAANARPASAAPASAPARAPAAPPAGIPPNAQFSPSQGKYWWQTPNGAWAHN